MADQVTDAFGNTFGTCSISVKMLTEMKGSKPATLTDAQWSSQVKGAAWGVIKGKLKAGELPKGTIVGRTPGGATMRTVESPLKVGIQYEKGGKLYEYNIDGGGAIDHSVEAYDWDFGPNMASLASNPVVKNVDELDEWVATHLPEGPVKVIDIGEVVVYTDDVQSYVVHSVPGYFADSSVSSTELKSYLSGITSIDPNKVKYLVTKVDLPPAQGLPVSSISKSLGALTNEDAATLFVKTKDELAQQAGISVKGASKLDDLVYKTISDQVGYTPAELKAKVEAYKATGKKLSALKKKVLKKSGPPTSVPTQQTVQKATSATIKEASHVAPDQVSQVWDNEAVAKAYIKAKDQVVALSNGKYTLYTPTTGHFEDLIFNAVFDELNIQIEAAKKAIADYIANVRKLSVLKKQMAKSGEYVPQADTLKKSGSKKATKAEAKALADEVQGAKTWADVSEAIEKNPPAPGTTLGTAGNYDVTYVGSKNGTIQFSLKSHVSGYENFYNADDMAELLSGNTITSNQRWLIKKPGAPKTLTGTQGVPDYNFDGSKLSPTSPGYDIHGPLTQSEQAIFDQWEKLNVPFSTEPAKLFDAALQVAKANGYGDNILPIIRSVDKGKAVKFSSVNKQLYEDKLLKYVKGGGKGSAHELKSLGQVVGDLLPDSAIFRDLPSRSEMSAMQKNLMGMFDSTSLPAIKSYTGSGYGQINGALRSGSALRRGTNAGKIQQAMRPLPENLLVRRGTSLRGLGVNIYEELAAAGPGYRFTELGFSSTTVNSYVSFNGQVKLIIEVPKGTKAAWVADVSAVGQGEGELILAARTEYEVIQITRTSSHSTEVRVRVVTQRDDVS